MLKVAIQTLAIKINCRKHFNVCFTVLQTNKHPVVFYGLNQSSNGSTIQYFNVLKTKIHEISMQCVTHFKHEYWIIQVWYILRSVQSTLLQLYNEDIILVILWMQ